MLAAMGKNHAPRKGETMWFGVYNGEPIQWRVISVDKRENKVLLLADSDCGRPCYYHRDVSSAMKAFNKSAFSAEEQAKIVQKDNGLAFLLTQNEIIQYLPESQDKSFILKAKVLPWYTGTLDGNTGDTYTTNYSVNNNSFSTFSWAYLRPAVWVSYADIPAEGIEDTQAQTVAID